MKTVFGISLLVVFSLIGFSCSRGSVVSPHAVVAGNVLAPPQTGMYFGSYANYDDGSAMSLGSAITGFEALTGKSLAWAIVFNEWAGQLRFPRAEALAANRLGAIPFIRILPRSSPWQTDAIDPVMRLDRILAGEFDEQVKEWARDAADLAFPLLVEFGPEANGHWNQWSGVLYPNGPALYASVYRHLITICRAEGVTNITWVFHVNGENNPATPTNQMAQFYPGDDYIDWIGVSVLGAQQASDYWDEFGDVMDRAYNEIKSVSATKPIALVETSVIEDPAMPGRKARWFQSAFTALKSGRWPRLKAYSYWNEGAWLKSGNDLRIDSSAQALSAFRQGADGGFFVTTPIWSPRQ